MTPAVVEDAGAPPTQASVGRTLREWHDDVRARQRAGDLTGAIGLLRRLIAAAPAEHLLRLRRDLVVLLRLANRQLEADRIAVELDPTDADAWARLSRHARRAQDAGLYVTSAIGWEAAAPNDYVVRHFADIARSIRDGADHGRASDAYVREVFDHYADRFDGHLALLNYRGPEVVAALVNGLVEDGDLPNDAPVADLGCGTGLIGHHLRSMSTADRAPTWSGPLTGVDLSSRMLGHAANRRRGDRPVYDELVETELVAFLGGRPDQFGAVVAADTFIYLGDLRPSFAAAIEALHPGGWLVGTVEHASAGQAAERGYVPDMSGRYLHDAGWIENELGRSGFDSIVVDELSIRREDHRPVPGLVVVARRPAA